MCHYRTAAAHGLGRHQPQPLLIARTGDDRRHDEQARLLEKGRNFRRRTRAQKGHRIAQAKACSLLLQPGPQRTVTDNPQLQVRHSPAQPVQGRQQVRHPLLLGQPSDKHDA